MPGEVAGGWASAFSAAPVDAMRAYEESMVAQMFEPWAVLLLDELAVAPGEALVDVACGTGAVARRAAARVGPAGRVTALDFSPAMLAVAQSKPAVPGGAAIEFRESPAVPLAVGDGGYDVATCQQGLQFFPDRAAATSELHRAVRPGGRIGVAVWCEIESCPPFAALQAAVRETLGDDPAARYAAGPWGMPAADDLGALLDAAGFEEVRVERRSLPVTWEQGPAEFAASLDASGIAPELAELPAEERARVDEAALRHLGLLAANGVLHSKMTSNVAFGVRR